MSLYFYASTQENLSYEQRSVLIAMLKKGYNHAINSSKGRKASFMKIASIIVTSLVSAVSFAADSMPSPESLLKKTVQAVYTNNEQSIYVMKLVDSGGGVSTRKMQVWFKSKSEDEAKLLIKFIEPADIRGTGFLTLSEKGKQADQWLYLPALKKSRRIKGGNADEPFLGSDFSMGDLSVDKSDGLQYKVEGSKKCGEADCYIVTGVPKAGADTSSMTYSKKTYHIRKDNYLGVRGEFYNTSGQLEKVLSVTKTHKQGNRWMVDEMEMKNVLSNHSTILAFEKRNTSVVPADSIFTLNTLEK